MPRLTRRQARRPARDAPCSVPPEVPDGSSRTSASAQVGWGETVAGGVSADGRVTDARRGDPRAPGLVPAADPVELP